MSSPWLAALAFLLMSGSVGLGMVVAGRLLGVRAKSSTPLKTHTYECGEEPEGSAWIKFHPRYYVVALVFVLFDVEAVFLFPWSLVLRSIGTAGLVTMFAFIAVLMLGWGYALKKGALRWQ